jgi:FtsZ-interacting cell division protein ZipA
MNWFVIIIFGIAVIGLVVFTIIRNQKDKKEYEQKLKNDYTKKKDKEGDIEYEE